MAKKWHNKNLPGALHFVTGVVHDRKPIFKRDEFCRAFLHELQDLRANVECKLIAFVLMLDHFHFVANPRDGDIQAATGKLKSFSAKRIINLSPARMFWTGRVNQVWQESFRALPLWSRWMIDQKINYIHANPVRSNLCDSAEDYPWTSFRAFYRDEHDPLFAIDRNWWWDDDEEKLRTSLLNWETEQQEKLLDTIEKNRDRIER